LKSELAGPVKALIFLKIVMKTIFTFNVLFFLFGILSFSQSSYKELRKNFLNLPLKYRMNQNVHRIPLDEKGQDSLIKAYLNNGYGGFTINVPFEHYLEDAAMKGTLRFCEKARSAGLELWLYDENGYPSGNAGDLVIRENPAWEVMGLFFDDTVVKQGPLHFRLPPGKSELVAAFPVSGKVVDYSRKTDLSGFIKGSYLVWNAPEGEWNIFAVTKDQLYEGFQVSKKPGGSASPHYPSLMIPEVTETFLRVNHEVYAEYLGNDLGKYFTSTFTDEPSLMAVPFEWYSWSVIPWQEVLSEEIKKRYGYLPEERLVELFSDKGPAGQQVRYQYFHTVGDLIVNNYFKPIEEWCAKHNFKSEGHLLLEETMMAQVPLYGDAMKCFREMDAPGIDILSCLPRFMPVHSPKLASSAAKLEGNDLVMSEPCPIMEVYTLGSEPSATEVRGHLNMLMAGGVTDFNNYLNLTHSDQKEKIAFNSYVGRTTLLLHGGVTRADIGVVYPIESLWTRFLPQPLKVVDGFFTDPNMSGWDTLAGGSPDAILVEQTFRNISRFMFKNRREYSYLDSRVIIESKVVNGELVNGRLHWKVIVLPAVSTLPEEAWKRLFEFAEAGGKIIALELMPLNTEKKFPDTEIQSRAEKLFETNDNARLVINWKSKKIEELLNVWLGKEVKLEDESLPIRIAHRQIENKDVFFIMNDSGKAISTKVTLKAPSKMEEWYPASGNILEVSNSFSISLLPYQAKIYRSK
jgi:hypothetical protein